MKNNFSGADPYGDYDFYNKLTPCRAYANYNMKAVMPHVHYNDEYWNEARTVWGAEEEGIHYEYSDRLFQWDYDKADKCFKKAAEQCGWQMTPEKIQVYLSLYHEKEVEIRHIMAGVNASNGYSYWVYGFKFKQEQGQK